jgi:hypothetical protein
MDEALRKQWMMVQQDQQISEAVEREKPRLRNFLRKRASVREDDFSSARKLARETCQEWVFAPPRDFLSLEQQE